MAQLQSWPLNQIDTEQKQAVQDVLAQVQSS